MTARRGVRARLESLERTPTAGRLSFAELQRQANGRAWERWLIAADRLVQAIAPEQRDAVVQVMEQWLQQEGDGCKRWPGLVTWTYYLERGRGFLPERIPSEVIDVYLTNARAQPDHDCADCGMAIPIRPCVIDDRSFGGECVYRGVAEEEVRYFAACPSCGGVTGQQAYWKKHGGPPESGCSVAP